MKITFPDGTQKDFDQGVSGFDVAMSISEGLARQAVGIEVNGEVLDLSTPLNHDATVKILTFKDEAGKQIFWHSTAHVLAMAVLELYPDAKLTIGPPIEQGFYYDFAVEHNFNDDDLKAIQAKVKEWSKKKLKFRRVEVDYEEAKKRIGDNKYKLEILEDYKDSILTFYENIDEEGNVLFSDLCKGPHVAHTGMIKAVALTKASSAYWRADAKNDSLQRIYGISYPDKKELKDYLFRIEEAGKRDHRKLGKDLDLFMFHEWSPGGPFFLEKGAVIYHELVNFLRGEYVKRGYGEVITPQMYNKKLWEQSGHWEHYKDDMFILDIEGEEHSLKPMNCPSHCLIFNREAHSYRDLPLRIADFCSIHRNELSGTLGGLTRVRKFAQDDGHIFCTMEQIKDEVIGTLKFIQYVWEEVFDFKLTYYLSTRPEKKLGDDALWDKSEGMLREALDECDIKYGLKEGDGAFYGPKIDIDLQDALGRRWQCPTCQLDFNLPARFNCEYEGADGQKHQAVMIHRAVLGSLERFIAVLIEHTAGNLPLWLSPEQIRVLPIADRHIEYANQIVEQFKGVGLRATVDGRAETTNKKVREAQLAKVNYILVVGDKEVEASSVNVRTRDNKVHGEKAIESFVSELEIEIADFK